MYSTHLTVVCTIHRSVYSTQQIVPSSVYTTQLNVHYTVQCTVQQFVPYPVQYSTVQYTIQKYSLRNRVKFPFLHIFISRLKMVTDVQLAIFANMLGKRLQNLNRFFFVLFSKPFHTEAHYYKY